VIPSAACPDKIGAGSEQLIAYRLRCGAPGYNRQIAKGGNVAEDMVKAAPSKAPRLTEASKAAG